MDLTWAGAIIVTAILLGLLLRQRRRIGDRQPPTIQNSRAPGINWQTFGSFFLVGGIIALLAAVWFYVTSPDEGELALAQLRASYTGGTDLANATDLMVSHIRSMQLVKYLGTGGGLSAFLGLAFIFSARGR